MLKILLENEDFANLKVFLERVEMTGKEVPAYISIMQKLSEVSEMEKVEMKEVK